MKRHLPKREDPFLGVKHEETTYIWERKGGGSEDDLLCPFHGQVAFRFHLSWFLWRQRNRIEKKSDWRTNNCWDALQLDWNVFLINESYQRCFVGTSCVKLAGIFSLLNRSLSTSSPPGKWSSIGAKSILSLMHSKKSENHSDSLFHWKVYGAPPIYWFITAPPFRSCAISQGRKKIGNLNLSTTLSLRSAPHPVTVSNKGL